MAGPLPSWGAQVACVAIDLRHPEGVGAVLSDSRGRLAGWTWESLAPGPCHERLRALLEIMDVRPRELRLLLPGQELLVAAGRGKAPVDDQAVLAALEAEGHRGLEDLAWTTGRFHSDGQRRWVLVALREERAEELAHVVEPWCPRGPTLFAGPLVRLASLGQSFPRPQRHQGLELLPILEPAWQLTCLAKGPAIKSERLMQRAAAARRLERWIRRSRWSAALGLGLFVWSAGWVWAASARTEAARREFAAQGHRLELAQQLRHLVQELDEIEEHTRPLAQPWPRLGGVLYSLAQSTEPRLGWERLEVRDGQLSLRVSAVARDAEQDLPELEQVLTGHFGAAGVSWEERKPRPSQTVAQTFHADLSGPAGSSAAPGPPPRVAPGWEERR